MKNFLAPVMQNKVVNAVTSNIGKFYIAHESAILTGGTIGFSIATTAVTYQNSDKIHYILREAAKMLDVCENDDQKKQVYTSTLKQLAPLVTPILVFQAATIGCAVFAKKQSDKRIAELAGALTVAQQAVSYYQTFQKEAEEALGEKRIHEIQKEIDGKTVYEASSSPVNTKQSDGDKLVYEPITGQLFWSTPDRINLAWEKYKTEVMTSEQHFVPVSEVFFDRMGVDSRTMSAEVFGYYNEDAAHMSDKIYLDSTTVMVNGEETAVLKMNYYPTVRLVTDEVFD